MRRPDILSAFLTNYEDEITYLTDITDHKGLDLIYRYGPIPAGRLAELTGLTTGEVTEIIDRLEKA